MIHNIDAFVENDTVIAHSNQATYSALKVATIGRGQINLFFPKGPLSSAKTVSICDELLEAVNDIRVDALKELAEPSQGHQYQTASDDDDHPFA